MSYNVFSRTVSTVFHQRRAWATQATPIVNDLVPHVPAQRCPTATVSSKQEHRTTCPKENFSYGGSFFRVVPRILPIPHATHTFREEHSPTSVTFVACPSYERRALAVWLLISKRRTWGLPAAARYRLSGVILRLFTCWEREHGVFVFVLAAATVVYSVTAVTAVVFCPVAAEDFSSKPFLWYARLGGRYQKYEVYGSKETLTAVPP